MEQVDLTDQKIADRYRVLSPLGEGAMGHVYLAEDTQLHRQVALKVLRREWVSRPEVAKRLENECRLMAHLGAHTSIVTLFDRLVHDGNAVLVMEYVPGETLADVLARTRSVNQDSEGSRKTTPLLAGISTLVLTPRDAVEIALQCLSALDFAHSKGILHRDIKPSNIMIARDHNGRLIAKLMDFGIGKALTDAAEGAPAMTALTMAGGPGPGTPAYMAPEQIDPARFGPLGPAADLYALGITLYEMLTLRLPFEGTYTELLNAHTNVEAPDPRRFGAQISPDLLRVIMKALKKDPNNRYHAANEFLIDLQAAGVGGGGTVIIEAPFRADGPDSRKRVKKFRFVTLLACVAAILIAVSIALPWIQSAFSKPLDLDQLKGDAENARLAAEQRFLDAGEPIQAVQAYRQGLDNFRNAEQAEDSRSWNDARNGFASARDKFSQLRPSRPSELDQKKQAAADSKSKVESEFRIMGGNLDENPTYIAAVNELSAAGHAERSERWREAISAYESARLKLDSVKPVRPGDIDKAMADAENAKNRARDRFSQTDSEVATVQEYQEAENEFGRAKQADDEGRWNDSLSAFRNAQRLYDASKPSTPPGVLEKETEVQNAMTQVELNYQKASKPINAPEYADSQALVRQASVARAEYRWRDAMTAYDAAAASLRKVPRPKAPPTPAPEPPKYPKKPEPADTPVAVAPTPAAPAPPLTTGNRTAAQTAQTKANITKQDFTIDRKDKNFADGNRVLGEANALFAAGKYDEATRKFEEATSLYNKAVKH